MKRLRRGLLGMLGLATVACATVHRDDGVPAGAGPLVGVYRVAIDDGHGAARGAKLSLWAERPDRLHVELIAPVGGVTLILDAGGGNACIVDTGAATARFYYDTLDKRDRRRVGRRTATDPHAFRG